MEATETPKPGGMKRLITFAAVAVTAVAATYLTPLGKYFSRDATSALAAELGWGGPLILLGAGLFSPLLFLPRWPVALVSGLLYGVFWGSLLANFASTLGAWLNFVLAKTLLAPTADRLRARYRIAGMRIPRDKAFAVLFLLRAFPLSNFVATNLLAGALKIFLRVVGIFVNRKGDAVEAVGEKIFRLRLPFFSVEIQKILQPFGVFHERDVMSVKQ